MPRIQGKSGEYSPVSDSGSERGDDRNGLDTTTESATDQGTNEEASRVEGKSESEASISERNETISSDDDDDDWGAELNKGSKNLSAVPMLPIPAGHPYAMSSSPMAIGTGRATQGMSELGSFAPDKSAKTAGYGGDRVVEIPEDEGEETRSLLFVSSGVCFIWCLIVLLMMVVAIVLIVEQDPATLTDITRTLNVTSWALLVAGSVFLLLVVVILRGRDKVSVYKPSILLNLVLSLIFYVAALAIHLPLLPVPEGGLAIGTLVLEVLSTATLLLLVIVVLLGADSQRGSSGEVMSFSNRMPASWEQELEFASRLIDEKEEALQRMKDETSKDSEIIASLQTKLKGAEKKEEHLLSREKEADRRLEKMARKGGRQVTLRAKVKSVQDENHAYQAEVNLLQSLQHNANQQNAAVENDIERLVGKVKKINEEKKAMRLELEHERSRTQTLQEEREKTAARITELEEEQEKHNRTIYMPAPAQECVNCKVYEAKHEHMQRSQMDATKLEDRLNAKTEEVTELQRRLREQEDLVRESRMGDKEREHLASKLLDLKREHAQCYAVAEEARRSYDQLKMSQAELTVVQRKFDESEVRVQGLTSGKIDLEKRLVELKGEVVGLNTSVKFMQDGKRGEEGIKTAQYDQMLSRETALQQEHNILKEKYSTLQSELRELEKSRYTLEGRHAEVTSKQQALDTELKSSNQTGVRVAELTSENTRVLAELSSARKEAEDAKRELERTKKVLYKKIAALKEELGTLSAELQSHKGDSRLRQELIEDARARFSSMKPLIGIEFTNSDSKGVRVTDVFPGKPADHAGIKVGDMVSSVNGEDTHTKKQFHAVMATLYPGDGVPFQVTRRHATETRVVHVSTPGLRLDEILAIRRVAHGIVQTEDLNAWKATRGV